MRVDHSLADGENRCAEHTLHFQRRDDRITARKTAEPALDDVLKRHNVVASRPRCVEAGIIRQFRHVHRLDHLLPLMRHHHDCDEVFASASKNSRWSAVGILESPLETTQQG
jgi:hypothetical protein